MQKFVVSWTSATACVICLSLSSACSTAPVQDSDLPPIPASTRQPCPPLKPLESRKQGDVTAQMIEDAEQYRDCALRHKALTDIVNFREDLKETLK